MRITLRSGLEEIEILGREHLLEPSSEEAVVALLGRMLDDPVNGAALRRGLADHLGGMARLGDRELLGYVARQVLSGRLKLVRRRSFDGGPAAGSAAGAAGGSSTPRQDEAAARQDQPAAAPASSPAAAAAATEEDPMLAGVDPAAQAATLAAAADSGAPLCEA
jgi:predicted lipid-binding transport protein (Tim44 family)